MDPIKIVVLQRGWTLVGRFSVDGNGTHQHLTDASVIRRWGTTKGLGEIAENGPTDNTVLDRCPPATFHELTVVFTLDCAEEKWASALR